ncbi:MAG: hypothetical protein C4325_14100 [Blastocatellia bacterium]
MNAVRTEADTTPASIRTLLSNVIDYAGLFPPSQLTMAEAVINYATYRNRNQAWMLGRFCVPAARLFEFIEIAEDPIRRDKDRIWHLAAIAGEDIYETINIVRDFNRRFAATAAIADVIEVRANTVSKIENTLSAMPSGITPYFEIPIGEELPELVSALALHGQRAKIRTGGTTPEAFPTSRQIIRFVRTCMAANVSFKATAGLHHPLRCYKPLTYEENAPRGTMHGFLNMLVMTGFARESYRISLLEQILEDEFEEAFEFGDGVTWRGEHFLGNAQLGWLRQKGMHSFGSCSFDEPVEDLRSLGLL